MATARSSWGMGYRAQNIGLALGAVTGVFWALRGQGVLIAVISFLPLPLWFPVMVAARLIVADDDRRNDVFANCTFVGLGWASANFIVGLSTIGVNAILYHVPGQYLNWLAILALPLGYVAYRFKEANLFVYGTVEVLVGIATAFGSTTKSPFPPGQGFAVIGAFYVVVRGFENRAKARKLEADKAKDASPIDSSDGEVFVDIR